MSRDQIRGLTLAWARQRRVIATLFLCVAFAIALYFLIQALRAVLTPVFLAFVIAYALDPVIDRFEARGVSRSVAIVIVLVVLMAVVVGFAFLIVPELIRQVEVFTSRLPALLAQVSESGSQWVRARFNVELPTTFDEVMRQFGNKLRELAPRALGGAGSIVQLIFTSTFTALTVVANLILIPLFCFYLLRDFDSNIAKLRGYVPHRARPRVERIMADIDRTMAGFFRGQLTVMLIQGTIYSIGLVLLDVPLGVGIGLLTGTLCFIPYVGQLTGLCLALAMCLLDYQSGTQIVGVVALYGGVNILDGLVITPRIVGGKVGLSPILVILALMVFGQLFGFLGVLLAVPLATIFKILLNHGLEYYRSTDLFREEDLAPALAVPAPAPAPTPAPAPAPAHPTEPMSEAL